MNNPNSFCNCEWEVRDYRTRSTSRRLSMFNKSRRVSHEKWKVLLSRPFYAVINHSRVEDTTLVTKILARSVAEPFDAATAHFRLIQQSTERHNKNNSLRKQAFQRQ